MDSLLESIISKINAFVKWFLDLVIEIFTAAWDFFYDGVCFVFEKFLEIILDVLKSIDMNGLDQNVSAWGSLPSEVMNILGLLGVGQAVAIISAAIVIRLILQLIPFTRLGS